MHNSTKLYRDSTSLNKTEDFYNFNILTSKTHSQARARGQIQYEQPIKHLRQF